MSDESKSGSPEIDDTHNWSDESKSGKLDNRGQNLDETLVPGKTEAGGRLGVRQFGRYQIKKMLALKKLTPGLP